MNKTWQLQEAKNRFSQVVNDALREGPQIVTRHGEEAVIVLSMKDYRKLSKPKENFYTFLRNSPLRGIKLDLTRDKSLARHIEL